MRYLVLLCILVLLALCQAVPQGIDGSLLPSLSEQNEETETTTMIATITKTDGSEEKNNLIAARKKDKGGMEQMYMMFMMCKALISTLLMFVGPIIQVKSFGLSVIGTLINIARFLMQLKESKEKKAGASTASVWAQEEDRIGLPYRNSLPIHYPPNFVKRVTVS